MPLSLSQLQALRTNITVTRASVSYQGQTLLQWWTAGDDQTLANFYNQTAVPPVDLWRPDLSRDDLTRQLDLAEFIAASFEQARRDAWIAISTMETFDATDAKMRKKFTDLFGGNEAPTTLADMTAIAKRPATYGEALYATAVAGANVSPMYGYQVTGTDVGQSRSA